MKALKFSIVLIFALSALTQAGAQNKTPSSASEPSDAQSAKEIDPKFRRVNDAFGFQLFGNGDPFYDTIDKFKQRLKLSKTKKVSHLKNPGANSPYHVIAENPNIKILGLAPTQINIQVKPPYVNDFEITFYNVNKVRNKKNKKLEAKIMDDIAETIEGKMKELFGDPDNVNDPRLKEKNSLFPCRGIWTFENCEFGLYYYRESNVLLSAHSRNYKVRSDERTPNGKKISAKSRKFDDVMINNFPKPNNAKLGAAYSKLQSQHLIYFVKDISDIFVYFGKPEFSAEKIAEICLENPDAEYKTLMDNVKRAAAENKVVVKEIKPDMDSIKNAIDAGMPVNCCVKTRSIGTLISAGNRFDLQRNSSTQQEYIKFLREQKNVILPTVDRFVYNEVLILGYNKPTGEVYTRKYKWISLQDLKTILASPLYTYSVKK